MISPTAQERITGWIDRSEKVLVDGRDGVPTAGCYVGPTIVEADRDDEILDARRKTITTRCFSQTESGRYFVEN